MKIKVHVSNAAFLSQSARGKSEKDLFTYETMEDLATDLETALKKKFPDVVWKITESAARWTRNGQQGSNFIRLQGKQDGQSVLFKTGAKAEGKELTVKGNPTVMEFYMGGDEGNGRLSVRLLSNKPANASKSSDTIKFRKMTELLRWLVSFVQIQE